MKKKILIVGGSGFLGSHVADAFSESNFKVTIFDKKKSSFLKNDQTMLIGDTLNISDLTKACKKQDYVFNFSGISDIDECKVDPINTCRQNILANTLLLEAAKINKVKRFFFASSIYVYSDSGSFYKVSKQASESMIECYKDVFNLNYTVLRYGSVYGPRSDERNAIYRYINSAITKNKIECSSDPNAVREYIHVKDAAKMTVNLVKDKYKNNCYTLTGTEKFKIKEGIEIIKKIISRKKIHVLFNKRLPDEHYVLTPYKYTPRLGKKIVTDEFHELGQGILELVEHLSSNQ